MKMMQEQKINTDTLGIILDDLQHAKYFMRSFLQGKNGRGLRIGNRAALMAYEQKIENIVNGFENLLFEIDEELEREEFLP